MTYPAHTEDEAIAFSLTRPDLSVARQHMEGLPSPATRALLDARLTPLLQDLPGVLKRRLRAAQDESGGSIKTGGRTVRELTSGMMARSIIASARVLVGCCSACGEAADVVGAQSKKQLCGACGSRSVVVRVVEDAAEQVRSKLSLRVCEATYGHWRRQQLEVEDEDLTVKLDGHSDGVLGGDDGGASAVVNVHGEVIPVRDADEVAELSAQREAAEEALHGPQLANDGYDEVAGPGLEEPANARGEADGAGSSIGSGADRTGEGARGMVGGSRGSTGHEWLLAALQGSAPPSALCWLFVKTLAGRTVVVDGVSPTMGGRDLCARIEAVTREPAPRLVVRGKQLDAILPCGLSSGEQVHVPGLHG